MLIFWQLPATALSPPSTPPSRPSYPSTRRRARTCWAACPTTTRAPITSSPISAVTTCHARCAWSPCLTSSEFRYSPRTAWGWSCFRSWHRSGSTSTYWRHWTASPRRTWTCTGATRGGRTTTGTTGQSLRPSSMPEILWTRRSTRRRRRSSALPLSIMSGSRRIWPVGWRAWTTSCCWVIDASVWNCGMSVCWDGFGWVNNNVAWVWD